MKPRTTLLAAAQLHDQFLSCGADGSDVRHDEDVAPFVEFWTFGRRDGQWKLKEVLPPATGKLQMQLENLDQGSSAQMMQWYYSRNRAV